MTTSRMRRSLWCWTFTSPTKDSGVVTGSDPSINGHLHYPNDVDRSLNEAVANKIRKYRADYNNNPPNSISFMTAIPSH
jgi:hypothetical protein